MFAFDYNPRGWALCNGAVLPIQQNTALFSILGVSFGGNGTTTFGLPDLRVRAAIGAGTAGGLTPQSVGQVGGSTTVALTTAQIPAHNHVLNSGTLTPPNPAQNVAPPSPQALLGLSAPNNIYIDPVTPDTAMIASSISPSGGGQPHENMQPYLAINFCIATQGVYPARN
ncbi:MAG: tail fiber protein [Erythrobacter sp.]|uniref:phage tail protein n=1 Tax=Erythrobacter sp. TaxID=1042 RepID=UPI0025D2D481|nr:tail fiber protein [Erythrobacter sp.]MCL9999650.1 tail fiber protein [Erythrobacter sp.]